LIRSEVNDYEEIDFPLEDGSEVSINGDLSVVDSDGDSIDPKRVEGVVSAHPNQSSKVVSENKGEGKIDEERKTKENRQKEKKKSRNKKRKRENEMEINKGKSSEKSEKHAKKKKERKGDKENVEGNGSSDLNKIFDFVLHDTNICFV
jgi:hypothetical protein